MIHNKTWRLKEEIVKRSISKDWDVARLEWVIQSTRVSKIANTCLCTKYPIYEISDLLNIYNNVVVRVGNCCVKKFIDDASSFIAGLKRIFGDLSASAGRIVIDRALKEGVISNKNYLFYSDTLRKRKLSLYQLEYRRDLNRRILRRFWVEDKTNKIDLGSEDGEVEL